MKGLLTFIGITLFMFAVYLNFFNNKDIENDKNNKLACVLAIVGAIIACIPVFM